MCLVQRRHLATARARVAEIERDHPARRRPDRARRGRHHGARPRAGDPAAAARRRHRGVAPRRGLRPRGRHEARARGQRRRHRRVLDLCRSLPAAEPAAVRQHLLRQRPLRGRVHRGRARRGPGLPQPLRDDQVRGRAAGPQGDGRRPARDHLPARGSSSATPPPARPRSTTAPTSSPSFLRRQPPVARRPGGRRRRRGQGLPGAARLRGRRDGRALGPRPLTGADVRPHRPEPAHGPRAGRHVRRPPRQAGRLGRLPLRPRAPSRLRARHGTAAGIPAEALDYFASPHDVPTRTRPTALAGPGWPARRSRSTPTRLLDFMSPTPRSTPARWSEPPDVDEQNQDPMPHARDTAARRQRQPHRLRARLRRAASRSSTASFRVVRDRHRRRRRRRRGAGPQVGRRRRRHRRHRHPRGARRRAVRRRPRGRREGDGGRDARPGHRRPRAARRPAGVGDPPRAGRDAGLLHQRPHAWCSVA